MQVASRRRGGARDGRWLYFRAALRSGQIGKAPDSGSGDCRFESYLLSQQFSEARRRRARRWSHRLVVRTPASHVGNAGSTPAGITNKIRHIYNSAISSRLGWCQIGAIFFSLYGESTVNLLPLSVFRERGKRAGTAKCRNAYRPKRLNVVAVIWLCALSTQMANQPRLDRLRAGASLGAPVPSSAVG